jgi:CubicO group peptidase (beta-lactamase class C family)
VRRPARLALPPLACALTLACALPAAAAPVTSCAPPGPGGFTRVAPAQVGMDAARLARAVHAIQDRRAFAVRIYRHGCLVGADTNDAVNHGSRYETWNLTTAIVSLIAARAMTLGLLSPADPVGSLVPEADAAHGAITIGDLLSRASGLKPAPDHLMGRDRVAEALTTPLDSAPGTHVPDDPAGASLLAEAVRRAVGGDLPGFAQEALMWPLGIPPWRWTWTRDDAGHVQGSFGIQMTADDLGRIGDLLRRGGAWGAQQLIAPQWLAAMTSPSAASACLGWSVWLNAAPDCNGSGRRLIGGLPAATWQLRGRFDQRVTAFPDEDVVIVRLGTTGADTRAPGDAETWERGVDQAVLNAITDAQPRLTPDTPALATDEPFREVAEGPFVLPAPGPYRARAVVLAGTRPATGRVGRRRGVFVGVACPPASPRACTGTATLDGATAPAAFTVAAGTTQYVRFRLRARPPAPEDHAVRLLATDDGGGVPTSGVVTLRP